MNRRGPAISLLALAAAWAGGCGRESAPKTEGAPEAQPGPGVEVRYIAHASFLLRSPGGTELLIDPYQSRVRPGYDFPGGIEPDAVLITHPHYDHDAGRFRGAPFPRGDAVAVVDGPGRFRIGDFSVTGVAGRHADPYGKEFGQVNTVMVIEAAGLRIAHVGDNGPLSPATLEGMGRVDVLMLPADGDDHILSPEQTRAMIDAVNPRIVIPMHYRVPDLEPDPESPSGLGELDPWLEGRERVVRLGSSHTVLRVGELPSRRTILVFEPSPEVQPPS